MEGINLVDLLARVRKSIHTKISERFGQAQEGYIYWEKNGHHLYAHTEGKWRRVVI